MIFSITTKTPIDINEDDQKKIAIYYLRNKFGLGKDSFIDLEENVLCHIAHYYSHNSWSEVVKDREASNEEVCLQIILNALK